MSVHVGRVVGVVSVLLIILGCGGGKEGGGGCGGGALMTGDWQATRVSSSSGTVEYPWSADPGDHAYHYGELWLSLGESSGTFFTYEEYIEEADTGGCVNGYDDEHEVHEVAVTPVLVDEEGGIFQAQLEIAALSLTLDCEGDYETMSCANAEGTYSADFDSDYYSASVESPRGGSYCD